MRKTFIEEMYFNDEWNMPPLSREQLLRRGFCCALGCLNCPYTKPRVKGNTELEGEV